MQPIIEIRGVGKKYRVADAPPYLSLRNIISDSIKNVFKPHGQRTQEFWALQDINITIEPGERLGIIGRNGAGKSTLLKILSRITPPTTGSVLLQGRVGSLLEVGTGFHPELTGRENIFLNGSILGLKKKDINQKLDAIIDFSGVEKFINTPLKHYSSGMQLRLAFSVAAFLEPEILLIDEVLAVGDAEFQKKCLGKMEEVSKKDGRTILFVSHDLSAISRLANSCILLDQGIIISYGNTENTITAYNKRKKEQKFEYINNTSKNKPQIKGIRVITSESNNMHIHGQPLKIEFEINVPDKKEGLALSFQIMNTQMQPILHFWVVDGQEYHFSDQGKYIIQCFVPHTKLYKGEYSLNTYLGEDRGKEVFDFIQDVTPFEVVMTGLDPGHSFGWQSNTCIYRENHEWKIQKK